jgi:lipoate-protein ligase B
MRTARLFCFSQPIDYADAWRWQKRTAASVRNDGAPEALALLEHRPVYTLGRRARYEHLLVDEAALQARCAKVVESDRGGDVTFHGPGQLVVYPILDLRARLLGPKAYVSALEETIIRTLAAFDITAERWPGRPGVWVDGSKVAALGVRVQNGVSMHGVALNVDVDLSWYHAIVPCGLVDASVTSMERILGASPGVASVRDAFIGAFEAIFDSQLEDASLPPVEEPVLAYVR